jgi:hypothetical protein
MVQTTTPQVWLVIPEPSTQAVAVVEALTAVEMAVMVARVWLFYDTQILLLLASVLV